MKNEYYKRDIPPILMEQSLPLIKSKQHQIPRYHYESYRFRKLDSTRQANLRRQDHPVYNT